MMPKQFLQPKALAGLTSLHRPPRGFGYSDIRYSEAGKSKWSRALEID